MDCENSMEKTCRELESLLKTSFVQDVIVTNCTVENLLSFGENFTSYMKKIIAKIKADKNSLEDVYHFVTRRNLNIDGIDD